MRRAGFNRNWVLCPILVCIFVVTAHEYAQAEEAEKLLKDAEASFASGDLERSLLLLKRAEQTTTDSKLLARIHLFFGLNHAVLRKPERAKLAFKKALTHEPTLTMDPNVYNPGLVAIFDEVRRALSGMLLVTADRQEAVLVLDGTEAGPLPFKRQVPIGRHRVEVHTRDGAFGRVADIVVPVEKEVRFEARLERLLSSKERASPSKTQVSSEPTRTSAKDGQPPPAGRGMPKPVAQVEGPHKGSNRRKSESPPPWKPEEAAPRRGVSPVWFWSGAAITVGLAGAAVATGLTARKKNDEYLDPATPYEKLEQLRADGKTLEKAAWLSAGFGVVASVATAILYFLTWPSDSQHVAGQEVVLSPALAAGGGKLILRGRF